MMRHVHRDVCAAAAAVITWGLISANALAGPLEVTNPRPAGDGKLEIQADDYGFWADIPGFCFGPLVFDFFDPGPVDPTDPLSENPGREFPSFMAVTFLHVNPDTHGGKIALSDHPCPDNAYNEGAGCSQPCSDGRGGGADFDLTLVQPNTYISEPDTMDSIFDVTGGTDNINLRFHLTQRVADGDPGPNDEISAFIDQTYEITNNGGASVDLILIRHIDEDMPWVEPAPGTNFYEDDLVGMDAAELGYPQVYAQDGNVTTAALMLRTTVDPMDIPGTTASYYYMTKGQPGNVLEQPPGHPTLPNDQPTCYDDPSCPQDEQGGGQQFCPRYVAGTDHQYWERPGTPNCWKDYVPGVGYGINSPGFSEEGILGDSSIGLEVHFTVAPSATYTITFETIYGFRATPPRFQAPSQDILLVDGRVNEDGLGEYLITVANANPGGGGSPDPIDVVYLDVEAGKLGSSGAGDRSAEFTLLRDGWTATNCTGGFDAEGHALFKLENVSGGSLNFGEAPLKIRFRLQANDTTEDTDAITGVEVPPLSTVFSVAQDNPAADADPPGHDPGDLWFFDACDAASPMTVFGPTVSERGGFWAIQSDEIAYLRVPSLSTWGKTLLVLVVAACGVMLVLRSRRPITT